MNRFVLIAPLVAAGLLPVCVYAQTTPVSQERDIARVISVSGGGVCEACPNGHQEMRRLLYSGSRIKTHEMTHCLGSAKAEAIYLTRDGKDMEGGDFELEGDEWQPLALPGAPEKMNPEQKRLGTQASLPPDDKGITMSTDPQLAAEIERKAELAQIHQFVDSLPTPKYEVPSQKYAVNIYEDRKLGSKVRTALAKSKEVDVQNIHVRAKDGAVVLHGTVPEQSQVERAGEVAKGVAGVGTVKNVLTIGPAGN